MCFSLLGPGKVNGLCFSLDPVDTKVKTGEAWDKVVVTSGNPDHAQNRHNQYRKYWFRICASNNFSKISMKCIENTTVFLQSELKCIAQTVMVFYHKCVPNKCACQTNGSQCVCQTNESKSIYINIHIITYYIYVQRRLNE